MDRNEILQAAGHCINGHRAQDYGRPENNFSRIARLWEAYTGHDYTPENVAVMLALLKIARLGSGRPHPDNYIDLAGYAALAGELAGQAAREAVEPVEDGGPNACSRRGCAACPLADGCANYGRHPAPQAVEPLGAARSPQEPANGPGGAGAFEPCTPLGSIKLQDEKPENTGTPRLIIAGTDFTDMAARYGWTLDASERSGRSDGLEALRAVRSPQEPASAPEGAGACGDGSPLGPCKLQDEKPESEPEGLEAGAYHVPLDSIRFHALPAPEAARPGGALDLVDPLAELMKAVENARSELARQGLQLVARYEIHRLEPADGEGAD